MLQLIIFGSPGSGKGTQAELIAKKFSLTHLSSGALLRQELENPEIGSRIKKYQNAGKLVPDKIIIEMVENIVAKKIKKTGFVFDGYPRTIRQAKELDRFFGEKKDDIDLVLNLKLSEKEALRRIMLRSKTSGRSDDNLRTIKNRFEEHRLRTLPILKYYREQKKLITIDGRQSVEEISKEIDDIIKHQLKNNATTK